MYSSSYQTHCDTSDNVCLNLQNCDYSIFICKFLLCYTSLIGYCFIWTRWILLFKALWSKDIYQMTDKLKKKCVLIKNRLFFYFSIDKLEQFKDSVEKLKKQDNLKLLEVKIEYLISAGMSDRSSIFIYILLKG
jgi:hypothetical protein